MVGFLVTACPGNKEEMLLLYLHESKSFSTSVKMTQNICAVAQNNFVAVKQKLRKYAAEVKKKKKMKGKMCLAHPKHTKSWTSRENDAIVFFFF